MNPLLRPPYSHLLAVVLVSLLTACSKNNDPVTPSYTQAQKDSATLTLRPFSIAVKSRFPSYFADGLTYPGPVKTITVAQGEALIKAFIPDAAQQATALGVYTNPQLIAIIASPELRVGLAAISKYKIGQEVITKILTGKTATGLPLIRKLSLGVLPAGRFAQASRLSTDQYDLTFNNVLSATLGWGPLIVHEAGHADEFTQTGDKNSLPEEAFLHHANAAVHALMVLDDPTLAEAGDPLREFYNQETMTLLNSGKGATLGILNTNNNQQVIPGSKLDLRSFLDTVQKGLDGTLSAESATNASTFAYLQALYGNAGTKAQFPLYNQSFLTHLDEVLSRGTSKPANQSGNDPFGYSRRIQMMKVLGAQIPASPLQ